MWRQRASGRRWVLATPLSTWTSRLTEAGRKTTAGGNTDCPLFLPLFLFFDKLFPLKWRTTVRTELLRTLTLLRTRAFCGISSRGEWRKTGCFAPFYPACLSLCSALTSEAAVCSAERKERVRQGGTADTKCFIDSSFLCFNSVVFYDFLIYLFFSWEQSSARLSVICTSQLWVELPGNITCSL